MQQVTLDEATLLADIRTKSSGDIIHSLSKVCTDVDDIVTQRVMKTVHREVERFSHLSTNLLSKSSAADLEEFTYQVWHMLTVSDIKHISFTFRLLNIL